MDIIIFSGQSNMQGQSETLLSDRAIPNAYEYKFLDQAIVPLRNPTGENITYACEKGYAPSTNDILAQWLTEHAAGSACYGHTNLVPAFCDAYAQCTGREVLAVHVAKGSTVIAEWMPGTGIYDVLVKKAQAAIEAVETCEHIYFVWLQGESDAIAGNSKQYYKEQIEAFNAALRKDLNIEQFGIIRVGKFTHDARDDEIISAQDEVCRENSTFLMLTEIASEINDQPEYMHPAIWGHYGARGLELLGKVSGEALARFSMNEI